MYEKASWDQFKELIQQIINTIDLNAIENTEQIENIAKEFTDSINIHQLHRIFISIVFNITFDLFLMLKLESIAFKSCFLLIL